MNKSKWSFTETVKDFSHVRYVIDAVLSQGYEPERER